MTPTRLAVLWTVAILIACSVPGPALPETPQLSLSFDKWVHVFMFLGFGGLWALAAPGRGWAVFAAGVAYAVGIELWQGALPIERSPDPYDALADVVGLALGLGLAALVQRRRPSNDPGAGVSR